MVFTPLLIIESHPVQYRAPVYARLNQICPGAFHVVYASDFSLKGGHDPGFGRSLAWDTDLLAGYPCSVLCSNLIEAPRGWNSLGARGLSTIFQSLRPQAVLLTSLNYRYDHLAYLIGIMRGIPVWIRTETQDIAFQRSRLKSYFRSLYYRLIYSGVSRAFPIGALNKSHLLRHGLRSTQLHPAPYCTPDRLAGFTIRERENKRHALRDKLGIRPDQLVVSFFGKLIPKKNPELLLSALPYICSGLQNRLFTLFVGSGELQENLVSEAFRIEQLFGIRSHFAGFVNQSHLLDWYLASDVIVLPSRQAGETWGLVVNEAMQAGCAVVISEAVGCSADFGDWERVRIIPIGSSLHLASALQELSNYTRSFTWASEGLRNYSIDAAAQALAESISELARS